MQVEVKLTILKKYYCHNYFFFLVGEVFDYLVAHGRMKEKEARSKFRQVCSTKSRDFN